MKHIILSFLMVATLLCGCDYIKNYDSPHLELSDSGQPYMLKISNFAWGYGVVGFNRFNGDFDRLDEKVYDELKGKNGSCMVYMQRQRKDKYGNRDTTSKLIGEIDLTELNKYQDWTYWQKEGGIRKLLYQTIHRTDDSTAVIDSSKLIPITQPKPQIDTIQPKLTKVRVKVYSFTEDDLYSTPEYKNGLDSTQFEEVDGTIDGVNFNYTAFGIIDKTGKSFEVSFHPTEASTTIQKKLREALKNGSKIEAVCDPPGVTLVDLVSAKIWVQQ